VNQGATVTRKLYWGKAIDVTFDLGVCLHAAECLRGLPDVFDVHRKPWVLPDAGDPFQIAAVIARCPTGALQYSFAREYLPGEAASPLTAVTARSDGPVWLTGNLVLTTDQGETRETRLALCRCGQSGRPPFCDASGPCTGWRSKPKPASDGEQPPARQAPSGPPTN
jgi:uncharacterized Fe-S cluster protein YjdI/CDGSH-type Zn-finger protein